MNLDAMWIHDKVGKINDMKSKVGLKSEECLPDLPDLGEWILVGDSQSGKTSLLQKLIPFDVFPLLCETRYPLHVRLRNATMQLYYEIIYSTNDHTSNGIFTQNPDEVNQALETYAKEHAVYLQIYSNHVPNITVIDLPSLLPFEDRERMITDYMNRKNATILHVFDSNVRQNASLSTALIAKVKPPSVIKIMTKVTSDVDISALLARINEVSEIKSYESWATEVTAFESKMLTSLQAQLLTIQHPSLQWKKWSSELLAYLDNWDDYIKRAWQTCDFKVPKTEKAWHPGPFIYMELFQFESLNMRLFLDQFLKLIQAKLLELTGKSQDDKQKQSFIMNFATRFQTYVNVNAPDFVKYWSVLEQNILLDHDTGNCITSRWIHSVQCCAYRTLLCRGMTLNERLLVLMDRVDAEDSTEKEAQITQQIEAIRNILQFVAKKE